MIPLLFTLLHYAAPVGLASIGETVGQKSGVINIGLEGSMLVAAFFGMLVSFATKNPWLGLLAATGAGVGMNLIFGWFTIFLGTDQVVVGAAMNLFALGLTGTLYRAKFGQTATLIDVPKAPATPVLVFMVASVAAIWFLLYRTKWGLAARSVGEYPKAAEAAGLSVHKLRLTAVAIGGAFAGLAGGYLALAISGSFQEGMTSGRGFVAIAMVTFGRWRPQFVFLAALLIGLLESLQFKFQSFGWHVPFQLFIALPYIVALLVLVIVGKGTVAPGSLAQPYRREK